MLLHDEPFSIHHGDCIPHMATMPRASVDFAVFSPPFPSVYAYTSLHEDIGNSEDLRSEGKLHFSFFFHQLRGVMKPGRVVVVHCTQIVRMKRTGGAGLYNFRDLLVRLAERQGFIFHGEWSVKKNQQAQAIRTRSRELQFAGLETDRANSRPALPDYLLKFLTPGENPVPVNSKGDVSRNDWITFADDRWTDIRETDTLNVEAGRGEDDTKHICPLQLGVINRLVRLYTNPGEIVFSPFSGIGSEGYEALKLGRRFYGCEIKPEYFRAAQANLARAAKAHETQMPLLALAD